MENKPKPAEFSILIVDDEKDLTEIYHHYLQNEFPNLYTAYDGLDALKILDNNTINLMIVDINMPRMNGLELITRVRKDYPNIMILVNTALPLNENHIKSLIDVGVYGFLFKPAQKSELMSCIRNMYGINRKKVA